MSAQAVESKIRLVVFSALYPNKRAPRHGIFVEERLRALVATGCVSARVVAPVPWFFSTHRRFGRYADFAAVPAREIRYDIEIVHPRYPVIPRVGMTLGPSAMAAASAGALRQLRAEGFDFDLIDANYFYPAGVAASRLARRFLRPLTITARGTDINTIAGYRWPRSQIRTAAARAAAVLTVSDSLQKRLVDLGVAADKITTLRNGVDLERFAPLDRDIARTRLGIAGAVWLAVGHLIERKGVQVAIKALPQVPEVTLLIVGDGPREAALRALAARLGVAERVRFVGHVGHDTLPLYYSAADALVLPSRSEGIPNVVLEAFACGTAVIASAVDGIPEVFTGPPLGLLLDAQTPAAIAKAWRYAREQLLGASRRAARRRYAECFSWAAVARRQLALFEGVLGRRGCTLQSVHPSASRTNSVGQPSE